MLTKEQQAKAKEIEAVLRKATAEKRAREAVEAEARRPKAEVVEFDPYPVGRPWSPGEGSPFVTINLGLAELQKANAEAARAFRRSRDPCGLGLYGHETMEEIVRRQNGED